jgi:hypothetical protein
VVTAFEIFEHLLNPYTILSEINPINFHIYTNAFVVFTSYRSKTDMWDRHYHEFEDWQSGWLWKTGWKIIDRQKWTNP